MTHHVMCMVQLSTISTFGGGGGGMESFNFEMQKNIVKFCCQDDLLEIQN